VARDWSSDVCSAHLNHLFRIVARRRVVMRGMHRGVPGRSYFQMPGVIIIILALSLPDPPIKADVCVESGVPVKMEGNRLIPLGRSEARRVGTACGCV